MTCPYRTQVLHIGDAQHQPNNTRLLSNVDEYLDGDAYAPTYLHKHGAQGLKPQIGLSRALRYGAAVVAHMEVE